MDIHKIRFRISGGFAGLVRGAEIDGRELSALERAALARLLKQKQVARAEGARDLQMYDFEVDTDAGPHHVEFDEMSTPERLVDLVQRLIKRARPVQP